METSSPSIRSGLREHSRTDTMHQTRCSCDLLMELSLHSSVLQLLQHFGILREDLERFRAHVDSEWGGEPADWRVRLGQRGVGQPALEPLQQLLAIVRSADCHAYRLLEQAGVSCGKLRKILIEQLRSDQAAKAHKRSPTLYRRSLRLPPTTPQVSPPQRNLLREDTSHQSASAKPSATDQRPQIKPIQPNDLPPLHGHTELLARLADALTRSHPRPPVLLGSHGSGRSTVALHLANQLNRPVVRLLATHYDNDEQFAQDIEQIHKIGGVCILDDLDRVLCETAPPFMNTLSFVWATGNPPLLTLLSYEGRTRLEQWIPGIFATLDLLDLPSLTGEDLHTAVRLAAPRILAQHQISLASNTSLGQLTRLAERFLGGLAMPGRALDLLDLSCARAIRQGKSVIDGELWLDIVSERSGVPRGRIEDDTQRQLLDLEQHLARQVVGHRQVLQTLCQLIRRNRAGFRSGRPVASVLLLGPSGVGKTEIAKALCEALFDRADTLIRLDMSEYAEAHTVARIVGAPPGYVGHEQGGALTDPLLQRPHCVVLLDEIEKAHRDVHQLLLQVLDEGRLTDGRGRTVDFQHALIIMTSNLGSEHVITKSTTTKLNESQVLASARAAFPVELWNRIEAPLVLHPLSKQDRIKICHRLAKRSSERLFRERSIRYRLHEDACNLLVELCGSDHALGARPLRHILAREVESRIAESILRGQLRPGSEVEVIAENRQIDFKLLPSISSGNL